MQRRSPASRLTSALMMVALMTVPLTSTALPNTAAGGEITFNKHVAPLVWKHCVGCHRPGEVAPFSLLTYRDVAKRAGQIRDITQQQIMPPWKPVPGHGDFANGRRLTADEIGLIRQWVADGALEGDAADLPTAPTFASDWQLGKPDLIVTLADPVAVPGEGRDLYQNVILPFEIPQGKYLKAVEFRPSNRRVVHHAVLSFDTSGKARERDAADPAVGFQGSNPVGRFLPGTLGIWTPGHDPLPLPTGLSMPWPKDADMVLNLHLHPSGKAEIEQSSIGFHFTDEAPQRTLLDLILIDTKIDIRPGDKSYHTQDSCVLPFDMEALSIFPHMHLIGKEIKLTATLPDGTIRPLLWIDDWDFNWQNLYEYAQPVRLPKGTKLTLECVHDNSADNPHNPKNPPEQVRWGEQTFNEMAIAFVNLKPVNDSDLLELVAHPVRRLHAAIVPVSTVAALGPAAKNIEAGGGAMAKRKDKQGRARRAADALKKWDQDGNGRLSTAELMAATGNRVPSDELEKIVHKFDTDGDKELNLTEAEAVLTAFGQ